MQRLSEYSGLVFDMIFDSLNRLLLSRYYFKMSDNFPNIFKSFDAFSKFFCSHLTQRTFDILSIFVIFEEQPFRCFHYVQQFGQNNCCCIHISVYLLVALSL